jgi:hypothetical protein
VLTPESYQFSWLVYAASVLAIMLCLYPLLRKIARPAVTVGILLALSTLLLTPVSVEPGAEHLAPAFIVGIFEFFTLGSESFSRSGKPIAVFLGVVILVELLVFIASYFLGKRNKKQIDKD